MAQIRISHLTFAYPSSYDDIFTDVSFSLDTDWKLGFIGRNGRGKTTFLQLLMGRYPFEGSITSPVDFAYFPFLVEHPEEWTLSIAQDLLPCLETWALCRELSLLEVEEEVLYRPFSTLSQGEHVSYTHLRWPRRRGYTLKISSTSRLMLSKIFRPSTKDWS